MSRQNLKCVFLTRHPFGILFAKLQYEEAECIFSSTDFMLLTFDLMLNVCILFLPFKCVLKNLCVNCFETLFSEIRGYFIKWAILQYIADD